MVIYLYHEQRICPSKNGAARGEAVVILRLVIGATVGAGLGYGWYKLVGCPGGACPLTRHPLITILYGLAVGVLVAGNFR
jgi:hypothetical protein